ncbi:YoaK family protein [Kitasatospora sp. NPDC096147]|uniref:YoaK family protein n=1 Tax=Kitasatospora sp. NPDC096147 TaxID=3364093 RepID=UPI0037F302A9
MFPEGHPRARLGPVLLVLTFAGGLVDAVSFLDLGKVFVANMTGNVAFLGLALAGVRELSATASGTALAGFLAGAAVAGRWGGQRLALVLWGQTALVAVALAGLALDGGRYAVLVPLALGMGLQNGVAHRLAVPDLATTVVTRTLAGLAADPPGAAARRRVLSVLALFLGALTGGLLHLWVDPRAALAGVLVLLLAVACWQTAAPRHAG